MRNKIQKITACAFITDRKGRVLVAKRADTKKFLPGKFELPGGHIEFGETLEEGIRRELKEEFGVDVEVLNPYYAFTYVTDDGETHKVEIEFFAKLKDGQAVEINPNDHSEIRWIYEKEVDSVFEDNDLEKEAVKKGFEVLRNKK